MRGNQEQAKSAPSPTLQRNTPALVENTDNDVMGEEQDNLHPVYDNKLAPKYAYQREGKTAISRAYNRYKNKQTFLDYYGVHKEEQVLLAGALTVAPLAVLSAPVSLLVAGLSAAPYLMKKAKEKREEDKIVKPEYTEENSRIRVVENLQRICQETQTSTEELKEEARRQVMDILHDEALQTNEQIDDFFQMEKEMHESQEEALQMQVNYAQEEALEKDMDNLHQEAISMQPKEEEKPAPNKKERESSLQAKRGTRYKSVNSVSFDSLLDPSPGQSASEYIEEQRERRKKLMKDPDQALSLIGVEPHWAEELMAGEMKWELQGGQSYVQPGGRFAIRYTKGASSKNMASSDTIGYADAEDVIVFKASQAEAVWEDIKNEMGNYSREEFLGCVYSKGGEDPMCHVIKVGNIQRLPKHQKTPSNVTTTPRGYIKYKNTKKEEEHQDLIKAIENNDLRLIKENNGKYPVSTKAAPPNQEEIKRAKDALKNSPPCSACQHLQ